MTTRELVLEEGEQLVPGTDELLYRQVTRHMVAEDGTVATFAFGPQTSDQGKPSFSRSTLVNAQESRDWHTANAHSGSLGVRAVSAEAVIKAGTWAIDDSGAPVPAEKKWAPGHCFVDYRGLERRAMKAVRASLYMVSTEIDTDDNAGVLFADPATA